MKEVGGKKIEVIFRKEEIEKRNIEMEKIIEERKFKNMIKI